MGNIKIDIIDDLETFQAIRNKWESVYSADPEAQFFLSWIWLSGVLKWYNEKSHESWFIVAATSSENSDYVAFFPLAIAIDDEKGGLYSKLSMAGLADSEHMGFICLPEYVESVSSAFAIFLQQQEEWSVFEVDNIQTTHGRMSLFLSKFLKEDFELTLHSHRISDLDQIDNSIIPYIALPDDWEEYLQNVVSTNTRQKIRRFFRKIEGDNEFHLTHVNTDNLELHLDILLGLWKSNWEGRKGAEYCQKVVDKISFTFRHCFENQCLYLPVLWRGDKPLGAIASLMDFNRKTILFFIGGRDDTVKDIPPGTVLHAYGIKYALENGFKVYDFMMGNEAYKFSFGAKERQIKIVVIQRKSQNQKLNVRTIPEALQISVYYQRANRLDEAERGYRQILEVQPQQQEALYRLGVVMQRKGDYLTAEDLFKSLLTVQPKDIKAWFSLGNLYQIQGHLAEAEKVYRSSLTLQPESPTITLAIYHNLGYALQQQDKWDEAIACYQKACELQPDSIEPDVILANALYARFKLPSEKQAHYAALNYELGNKRKQSGDLKGAIEYYQQSIAMNPTQVEPHYHLGVALQEQGNWEEAIACYQKAQELQPDYIQAEVSLANALYSRFQLPLEKQAHYAAVNYDLGSKCEFGDLKGAIEYYRQSIAMNPDKAEVQYHLGLALQTYGNWEEAIACYQKAQELQKDYIQAELALANVRHAQNKLSTEDQDRYAVINYDLGNVHQLSGDLKGAIKYYRQAITLQPDLAAAREHLRLALEEQENLKIKVSCVKR